MKRRVLISVVLVAVLALSIVLFAACDDKGGNETSKPEPTLKIVYLGDSIAEALIGPSPISERDYYGYSNILAKINNFESYNRSVSGHRTSNLLDVLTTGDGGEGDDGRDPKMTIAHVKTADVIHISILGNDLLQEDRNAIITEAFEAAYDPEAFALDTSKLDGTMLHTILYGKGADNNGGRSSVKNLTLIVEKLKDYNPDAKIYFQAVYNPFCDASTLLEDETKELLRVKYGENGAKSLRSLANLMLKKLNDVLDIVQEDLTENGVKPFEILDAAAAFDAIWDESTEIGRERGEDLIFPDWTHPSNYGHAVLADLTQKTFLEDGIISAEIAANALKELKAMRISMLERMYAKSVDVAAVSAEINAAETNEKVTEIFFDTIRGKQPEYV